MTLPQNLPGDPQTGVVNLSITVPEWVFWHLVNTSETVHEEMSHMFYVAARAILSDFNAVEAIALKKIVTKYVEEGFSDPKISKILEIPAPRIRNIRRAFGIESRVQGRGRKAKFAEIDS